MLMVVGWSTQVCVYTQCQERKDTSNGFREAITALLKYRKCCKTFPNNIEFNDNFYCEEKLFRSGKNSRQ